ncbi:hypothetical protein [Cryptosporangium arvum]|uniref:hypothetical protein n=1 Tax=Cryptosporangium arvum TaxID=80871 RepID=UPI000686B5B1|nr:hypothetical protein [Cryptosporangium arvum]
MSPSEVLNAAADARDNAALLGADRAEIPRGQSAWVVREWWEGLTADQRQAYLTAYPSEIGALNGIPAIARDHANRTRLDQYIAQMQANADALYGTPGGPIYDESYEPARKLHSKLEDRNLYLLGFNPDFGHTTRDAPSSPSATPTPPPTYPRWSPA